MEQNLTQHHILSAVRVDHITRCFISQFICNLFNCIFVYYVSSSDCRIAFNCTQMLFTKRAASTLSNPQIAQRKMVIECSSPVAHGLVRLDVDITFMLQGQMVIEESLRNDLNLQEIPSSPSLQNRP